MGFSSHRMRTPQRTTTEIIKENPKFAHGRVRGAYLLSRVNVEHGQPLISDHTSGQVHAVFTVNLNPTMPT